MSSGIEFELRWPVELLRSEIAFLQSYPGGDWAARGQWLLTEAFSGEEAEEAFSLAASTPFQVVNDPLAGLAPPGDATSQRRFLRAPATEADSLRQEGRPRPSWPQRAGRVAPRREVADGGLRRDWVRLVMALREDGYLS